MNCLEMKNDVVICIRRCDSSFPIYKPSSGRVLGQAMSSHFKDSRFPIGLVVLGPITSSGVFWDVAHAFSRVPVEEKRRIDRIEVFPKKKKKNPGAAFTS